MGCSCLLRKNNTEEVKKEINDDYNNISKIDDIENNNNININNNNNQNIENNNINNNTNNNNYSNVIVSNQLKIKNKICQNSSQSQMENKRAKSTPLNQEEDNKENNSLKESSNDFEYKQIETDLITTEELQNFLSNYESLNDSVEVEIRPTTICENKTIYYGEWDKKKINDMEGGYKYGQMGQNIWAIGKITKQMEKEN